MRKGQGNSEFFCNAGFLGFPLSFWDSINDVITQFSLILYSYVNIKSQVARYLVVLRIHLFYVDVICGSPHSLRRLELNSAINIFPSSSAPRNHSSLLLQQSVSTRFLRKSRADVDCGDAFVRNLSRPIFHGVVS